jgi:hypothetical protein
MQACWPLPACRCGRDVLTSANPIVGPRDHRSEPGDPDVAEAKAGQAADAMTNAIVTSHDCRHPSAATNGTDGRLLQYA